jgi:hypothetical protein
VKAILSCTLLLLLVAGEGAAEAAVPLVQLQLIPERTLPGVPVNVVLTVTNPGDEPVDVLSQFPVTVTPPQGSPYLAIDDTTTSPRETFSLPGTRVDPTLTLPARSSRVFVMEADVVLGSPAFFMDERLSLPGTYRLRVKIWVHQESAPLPAAESNEVTLTVLEPQGADRLVWDHMLQLSNGEVWNFMQWMSHGPAVAKYVFENARDSAYAAHVAHFKWGSTPEEQREGIEHALALRPEGPIRDQLEGTLAGWYFERGATALKEGNLERALDSVSEAKRRVIAINRATPYPWVRENGERWLTDERLFTEGVVRERYASRVKAMSSWPEPVVPFVECVDPGLTPDDPYIVWFGYVNPNPDKFVEWGKGNALTPSASQQPPRVLQPGRQRYGFSVTTHANQVTWALEGKTATASRDTQPRCSLPKLETLQLRPVAECVETNGENVVVRFGYENPNAVAVRIAPGAGNQLTGTTELPPAIFEPGRHYDVLRVKTKKGAAIAWSLGGRNATSSSPLTTGSCQQR